MDRIGARMRKLISLLLALNLGVFLAGMALQHWSPDASAPMVFNADKIRLLALPAPPVRTPNQTAPELPPEKLADAPDAPRPEANARCLSWTSLDAAGVKAVETRLRQAGVAVNAYDIKLEQKLGWWVFLPPLDDAAEAQTRIDQIRLLGITDYATVRGGAMRNALSLGAFTTLAQARAHRAMLSGKGVEGVQYSPRPEAGLARLVFAETVADDALPDLLVAWPEGLRPTRCTLP